ncbi:VOC family protein [Asanoa sp. NPDC049518]|uniref:VOC family protein n=1 Tax=unclassified Asanoa TaxID=2685164 RepID=UPI00343BFB7A
MAAQPAPAKNPSSPFASARGDHAAVRVPDYAEARRWYTEKLDFRVVAEWSWAGLQLAYLAPPNDDTFRVELFGGGNPDPGTYYTNVIDSLERPGYHHFCLRVDDVDEVLAELDRRGVTIFGRPFDLKEINSRLALIGDPWGNMIELSAPLAS